MSDPHDPPLDYQCNACSRMLVPTGWGGQGAAVDPGDPGQRDSGGGPTGHGARETPRLDGMDETRAVRRGGGGGEILATNATQL